MTVRKTIKSLRPPKSSRLRLSAHAKIVLRGRYLAKNSAGRIVETPASETKAEVAAAFLLAYQLGCKGLTVFRTGSREQQVFSCSPTHPC